MKLHLLIAYTLLSLCLQAQDTIKPPSYFIRELSRFDIGAGVQVNRFGYLGTSAGPMFTSRASAKNGRIAGYLTVAYNLNNTYEYYSPYVMSIPDNKQQYFISNVRYNFLKLSLGMQIPLFNRTNKKGFSVSGLLGLSYCNGLGSGEIESGFDKPGAPSYDSIVNYYGVNRPIYSQKFSRDNYNLLLLSLDIGLSLSYTFKRYQVFADGSYLGVGIGYGLDKNYGNPATAPNLYKNSRLNLAFNLGMRYILYKRL